jgi:methionyl aminopeptidase
MITKKSKEEIEILREGGGRLAAIVYQVAKRVAPGVLTTDLDDYAAELIAAGGDEGSFYNYRPLGMDLAYPAHMCISVNDEIVHGIPSKRALESGDIVTLDLGLKHQGLFTDMAITVAVGKISPEARKLVEVTRDALQVGIDAAKPGNTVGDIGYAIESFVKPSGFGIVRELSGHGVGYKVHEDPYVPNYGRAGSGEPLEVGMVIAIEPMLTLGSHRTRTLSDQYTVVTKDGSLSAHFEHTVAITEKGPKVLTLLKT